MVNEIFRSTRMEAAFKGESSNRASSLKESNICGSCSALTPEYKSPKGPYGVRIVV